MVPIMACSIVALAIIVERLWALRTGRVMPKGLFNEVWSLYRKNQIDSFQIHKLKVGSPLGAVLAAALSNQQYGRAAMTESIEQAGRQVVNELERYLNTLGTIASVAPYLGLLGSVVGMIQVFSTFSEAQGITNPARLAGGISEILVATAGGLAVAIPSLIFYRYFEGRVNELSLAMEDEATRLMEALCTGLGEDGSSDVELK